MGGSQNYVSKYVPSPGGGGGALKSALIGCLPAGMSKFISGVVGAKFSPTVLLAGGLMCTAAVNIAFGFGASLAWFCFFWGLNGTLQVCYGLAA